MQTGTVLNLNLNASDGETHHTCETVRDGDWIIYRCPKCSDYEHRFNWRTGEFKMGKHKPGLTHSAMYYMNEPLAQSFVNQN